MTTHTFTIELTLDSDKLRHAEDRIAVPVSLIETALAPLIEIGAATSMQVTAEAKSG